MRQSEFNQHYIGRVNRCLDDWLPPTSSAPIQLHRAMRYVTCQGGKRIRPLLVYATGIALNAPLADLDRAAVAVELIHAYSLTHDDLPAMDNDELRRGQPTCHIAFDEATAILTGDALQSLAFGLLAEGQNPRQLQMVQCLAQAAGSYGMAGGQSLDLLTLNQPLSLSEIEQIHRLKTGALIMASVQLGAYCSPETDEHVLTQLKEFASHLGLAYQVQDDLFDVDERNDEHATPCYVSLLGVETCQTLLAELAEKMRTCLHDSQLAMPDLTALYQSITERTY